MVADTSDVTEFTTVAIRPLPATTNTTNTETITNTTNTAINDLSPGQWVIVAYDGEHHPGEITQISLPNIEVSVMHKSGQYWKWPNHVDKLFYIREDIIRTIYSSS